MNQFIRSLFWGVVVFVPAITFHFGAIAQTNSYPYKVSQDRMLWHDKVDKQQNQLLALGGGSKDSLIRLSKDENVNLQITDALIRRVDEIQQQIEFDSILNTNNKKRYLGSLESLLRGFDQAYGRKNIQASQAPMLITAFQKAMLLDEKGQSIEPVVAENSYIVGRILVDNCFLYPTENIGIKPSNLLLTRKYI